MNRTLQASAMLLALSPLAATDAHALEPLHDGDIRARLQEATGGQPFVSTAPLIVAFSIVPARISGRHGDDRAIRYSDFEAGHAGQNLLLQAVALDLGGVPLGSFDDRAVCQLPSASSPRNSSASPTKA